MESTVELDYRRGADIEVSLLWQRGTDHLIVTALDIRTGELLAIPVAADQALRAFRHPYAYAASIGLDYRATSASMHRADLGGY